MEEKQFELTVFDKLDILRSIKAVDVLLVLSDIKEQFRNIRKYSEEEFDIEKAIDIVNEAMEANNINLDELLP